MVFIVAAFSVAACHEEDFPDGTDPGGNSGADTYITLRLGLSRQARATGPAAGEDGDGEERGIRNENNIYDLTLFLYDSPAGKGANDDGNILVSNVFYLKDIGFRPSKLPIDGPFVYRTPPLAVKGLLSENTKVIVACNMGDLTGLQTLEDIRAYAVDHPWTEGTSVETADRFTMASEDEAVVRLNDDAGHHLGKTKEKPIEIALDVERTAARIDFCANPEAQSEDAMFTFAVRPAEGGDTFGDFSLTHVRPVNVMQQPSRMLKATAGTPWAETIDFYGKETVDDAGHADNYVVEPTTPLKTAENRENKDLLASWFGATAVEGSIAAGFHTDAYRVAGQSLRTTVEDGRTVKSYVVGYARENTMAAGSSWAEYVTGLSLRGTYCPQTVYSAYSAVDAVGGLSDVLTVDADYKAGTTFWRYLPLATEMEETSALYFSSREAAEAYRKAHPETVARVTEYKNGVCYYYVWIRHAGNDRNVVGPMSYGIVRNNIYRVAIGSLTGPGTPQPDPRGPEHIRSIIYVKKWNVREEDEIIM